MNKNSSLGFIVNSTGRRLNQAISHSFQGYDITTEQWIVLKRLVEQDGVTQKELGQRAEKDPTNMTRILDQLARKGLIERKVHPRDRRASAISLTKDGADLYKLLLPIELREYAWMSEGLTEEQLDTMREVLVHIAQRATERIQEKGADDQ